MLRPTAALIALLTTSVGMPLPAAVVHQLTTPGINPFGIAVTTSDSVLPDRVLVLDFAGDARIYDLSLSTFFGTIPSPGTAHTGIAWDPTSDTLFWMTAPIDGAIIFQTDMSGNFVNLLEYPYLSPGVPFMEGLTVDTSDPLQPTIWFYDYDNVEGEQFVEMTTSGVLTGGSFFPPGVGPFFGGLTSVPGSPARFVVPTSDGTSYSTFSLMDESGAILGEADSPIGTPTSQFFLAYHPTGSSGAPTFYVADNSGFSLQISEICLDLPLGDPEFGVGSEIDFLSTDQSFEHFADFVQGTDEFVAWVPVCNTGSGTAHNLQFELDTLPEWGMTVTSLPPVIPELTPGRWTRVPIGISTTGTAPGLYSVGLSIVSDETVLDTAFLVSVFDVDLDGRSGGTVVATIDAPDGLYAVTESLDPIALTAFGASPFVAPFPMPTHIEVCWTPPAPYFGIHPLATPVETTTSGALPAAPGAQGPNWTKKIALGIASALGIGGAAAKVMLEAEGISLSLLVLVLKKQGFKAVVRLAAVNLGKSLTGWGLAIAAAAGIVNAAAADPPAGD
ncbi:MAG: hypothetical protein KDC38_10310, partial [Planctomycetes bacterium]|nr:hypothetical protein [Planctomycetota bacterium]